jgi:predicted glycogen debranching enzyme
MTPGPGQRLVRFVGDRIRFTLCRSDGSPFPPGWRAHLRTNLGRAARVRDEILRAHFHQVPPAGHAWHDIPLHPAPEGWFCELALAEVGFFSSKAYATDPSGVQHWPDGGNFGLSVHPDLARTANSVYCAFPRQFGATRALASTRDQALESQLRELDTRGYTVIPPSGKLRDLAQQLPHIFETLGFRILHLLPVNPTPTTYARYGRFGSPYACQDLLAIDPALVEFDRRTTGVEQFCELAYGVHDHGGRLFLDVVINHTGWGATLQENHPEWYLRSHDGGFVSPGAWGVTWEDLAELEHKHPALWVHLSDVFLTWCRRGVDGFRCDAGYKVPLPAWQYIISRVRQEFPNTLFLLEGLGGPWSTTEELLTEGGMQWAYSELFQNHSGREIAGYLDYALRQSAQVGGYVHYSETHDNNRLAATGRTWSIHRNQLCALTSVCGGFGITAGVEWLAAEKINVHSCGGLNWGAPENIVPTLAHLNRLLSDHPCFFDGAVLERLSPEDSPVYALSRRSATGEDQVLVLVNTDAYHERHFIISRHQYLELGEPRFEIAGHARPTFEEPAPDEVRFTLLPAACLCLSGTKEPRGLRGDAYREARARAAWAVQAVARIRPGEALGPYDWRELARVVDEDPVGFLSGASHADLEAIRADLLAGVQRAGQEGLYPVVVEWTRQDVSRVVMVPPRHWLLLRDERPFRASLQGDPAHPLQHVESISTRLGQVACFHHDEQGDRDLTLTVERYAEHDQHLTARVHWLPLHPTVSAGGASQRDDLVLLTNGRGGMARLAVDLGRIRSKYDCALGANLHPSLPVDRHVLAKRVRFWVVADGFISPLGADALVDFSPGPPARWRFEVNAGDGRKVRLELEADMLEGRNTVVYRVARLPLSPDPHHSLPAGAEVSVTARVDVEDRNFHWETHRNPGAEQHFSTNTRPLERHPGFEFTPAADRGLRAYVTPQGTYHPEPEWCLGIPHPVEQSRGQEGNGDAYSPGWFSLPMREGQPTLLVLTADPAEPSPAVLEQFTRDRLHRQEVSWQRSGLPKNEKLGRALVQAVQAYVVRRGDGRTVIAGYPWFLDWGRDSLIAARGLLSAGMVEEVRQLLQVFGRFESQGTLPNTIHGENASNRDTSDAPLWYGVVCEELAVRLGRQVYSMSVDGHGRTVGQVLRSIAAGYRSGTPNGIRMDPDSGLIWSPAHFTWMDTNYPAGTPREGYPVEIQALWIRLLRQVASLEDPASAREWQALADRASQSFQSYYWRAERGYLADLLVAGPGVPASEAVVDTALRSNGLFAVSLGLVTGEPARLTVHAAHRHLVVPGALRSLAPLPVHPPLPILGPQGQALNDPVRPYWGRYEGDEDTRRKPAYHNGTAWTWTFPTFCEAIAIAWDRQPAAVAAARALLGSAAGLLRHGCVGHLPEVLDGDQPHAQRGCDAQAWSATEALRVWRWLNGI